MSTTQPMSEQWWDIQEPVIPKRSSLYNLEPIGIGTSHVESLTGYIQRLAREHCLTTWFLISKKIGLVLEPEYHLKDLSHKLDNAVHEGSRINGTATTTLNWIRALEKLTGRSDLRFLTLLSYKDVLSCRKLIRKTRAWCPYCYRDWLANKQVVYEPLIWALEAIKVCAFHKEPLSSVCPQCGQSLAILSRAFPIDFCYKCGDWLGNNQTQNHPEQIEFLDYDMKQQAWFAESTGDLIASTPNLAVIPKSEKIAVNLSLLVEHITSGSMGIFARNLQMKRNFVLRACLGERTPSLENLLRICYELNISLRSFLISDSNITDHIDHNSLFFQRKVKEKNLKSLINKSNCKRKNLDQIEIQVFMKNLLENCKVPPSLTSISQKLGCSATTLHRHAPDLCRQVVQRRRELRDAGINLNVDRMIQSFNTDCVEFLTSSQLRDKLLFALEEPLPRTIKEIAKELGYSTSVLSKYHKDLCHRISKRWQNHQAESRKQNLENSCNQVRQAVAELHSQGISITRDMVTQRLSKPSHIRYNEVYSLFVLLKNELEH